MEFLKGEKPELVIVKRADLPKPASPDKVTETADEKPNSSVQAEKLGVNYGKVTRAKILSEYDEAGNLGKCPTYLAFLEVQQRLTKDLATIKQWKASCSNWQPLNIYGSVSSIQRDLARANDILAEFRDVRNERKPHNAKKIKKNKS